MFLILGHNILLEGVMVLKKKLGRRIQELRYKYNLKQAELAEAVGIAAKTQSCIETGKNYPSAELVERYAKVFGIDVSELMELGHIKTQEELKSDIDLMIKSATSEQIILVYKILRGIFH